MIKIRDFSRLLRQSGIRSFILSPSFPVLSSRPGNFIVVNVDDEETLYEIGDYEILRIEIYNDKFNIII